jgi:hypothetical protein
MTCFAIVASLPVLLGVAGWLAIRQNDAAEAHRRAQWRQQEFNRFKQGKDNNDRAMVMDGELLAMLAGDPDCVNRVTTLDFTSTTITPEAAAQVARLKNVREITFYDTQGADEVLSHARHLPIEKLYFSTSRVSPDSLRSLANFPQLKRVDLEFAFDAEHIEALETLPPEIAVHISQ